MAAASFSSGWPWWYGEELVDGDALQRRRRQGNL
jgi:hypothetical protein